MKIMAREVKKEGDNVITKITFYLNNKIVAIAKKISGLNYLDLDFGFTYMQVAENNLYESVAEVVPLWGKVFYNN